MVLRNDKTSLLGQEEALCWPTEKQQQPPVMDRVSATERLLQQKVALLTPPGTQLKPPALLAHITSSTYQVWLLVGSYDKQKGER
jgi:hypothetical protein